MKPTLALFLLAFGASTLAIAPPAQPSCNGGNNNHQELGLGTHRGCPRNFKNAALNGAGGLGNGLAQPFIDKVIAAGAASWLTFQMNISGVSTQYEIPMMAFARDVSDAVALVNGPNPPEWLLTFNEPDYSYMGWTPTMTPQEAAVAIRPLLANPGRTKYVAPNTADPTSDWLPQFYEACQCKDFFSVYNLHVYQPTVALAETEITAFHNKFSDKPLWVTEIAPGGQNPPCSLSWEGASQYMRDIYAWGHEVGWIDRIFWNTINEIPNDQNVCNSYLIDAEGNPSPLLETFRTLTC